MDKDFQALLNRINTPAPTRWETFEQTTEEWIEEMDRNNLERKIAMRNKKINKATYRTRVMARL